MKKNNSIKNEILNNLAKIFIIKSTEEYLNLRKIIVKKKKNNKVINYLDNGYFNIIKNIDKIDIFNKKNSASLREMSEKTKKEFDKIFLKDQRLLIYFKKINLYYNLIKDNDLREKVYKDIILNTLSKNETTCFNGEYPYIKENFKNQEHFYLNNPTL